MTHPVVTVLIPNFRTLDLTRTCLRLLRKHTDCSRIHVIAIDNDSRDASTEYLRSLEWIELIERPAVPGEDGPSAHSAALDMAVTQVTTPYFLSMHTDTLVRHPDWLDYLLSHIEDKPRIAGVGSWKLENKTAVRRFAKKLERSVQGAWYDAIGKTDHKIEGKGKNQLYLRSHCALYRTDPVRELGLEFRVDPVKQLCCGERMHRELENAGYHLTFLESEHLGRYMHHINHATSVLNPDPTSNSAPSAKQIRRVHAALQAVDADAILADASLDR